MIVAGALVLWRQQYRVCTYRSGTFLNKRHRRRRRRLYVREIKFVRVISGANETNSREDPEPRGGFFLTSSKTRTGRRFSRVRYNSQWHLYVIEYLIFTSHVNLSRTKIFTMRTNLIKVISVTFCHTKNLPSRNFRKSHEYYQVHEDSKLSQTFQFYCTRPRHAAS